MSEFIQRWKSKARKLRIETYALYLACRDPRTPWHVRIIGACVVAYAFSPIDLIPDFIPLFGYLDDLVLVPLGIALILRMIPNEVLVASRSRAVETMSVDKPATRIAAIIVLTVWLILAALSVAIAVKMLS